MSRLFSSVYVELAEAKAGEGDLAAAEVCFRSALAEDPGDLDALVAFARVLTMQPDGHASAELPLKRACAMHPAAAAPRVALAKLYHAAGRNGQARDVLAEAARLEPLHPDVRAHVPAHQRSEGGLLQRLALLAGRIRSSSSRDGPGSEQVHRTPATCRGAARPPGRACPYCGSPPGRGSRICSRCGATL